MWSLLGWPCIHLPTAFGDLGLPVGVQWIGRPDTDAALLQWAEALHPCVDMRAA
jgi:amidase